MASEIIIVARCVDLASWRYALKKIYSYLVVMFFLFSGCVAKSSFRQISYDNLFHFEKFEAPLDIILTVETGYSLFVEGSYIKSEEIIVEDEVNKMIPGAMMIPFPVKIDPGKLRMTLIDDNWKYFCAEKEKSAASFPGLGSVVRDGDCIGIRQSLVNGDMEWFVDNSNYNRGYGKTIWHSKLSKDDMVKYKPVVLQDPFKINKMTKIVFNGYYGGQVHFTYEELDKNNIFKQDFIFDYAPGQELPISIKGHRLTILNVDNIRITYKWDKINS